jgi:hypothetical protein
MSGQSPRSWNLPGSFSGFLASSRHSASDPEAETTQDQAQGDTVFAFDSFKVGQT